MDLHSVLLARWVGEFPFVRVLHCYIEQASGLVTREPESLFIQLGLWNLLHFQQLEMGALMLILLRSVHAFRPLSSCRTLTVTGEVFVFLVLQQCRGTARNLFVLCTKDIR